MNNMTDKQENKVPIDENLMAFILNMRLILSYVLGWQDERNTVNRWAWHILARAVQFALFASSLALVAYPALLFAVSYLTLWLAVFLALWAWQIAGLVWGVSIAPVWKVWKDEAGQRKWKQKAKERERQIAASERKSKNEKAV